MRREEKEQQWDVLYVCLCVLTKASVNSWKAKARHLFACLGFHLTFFASLFTQLNKYISKGVPCMLRESKSKRTTIRSNTNTNVNAIPHATRRVHWRLRSVNIGFCLQTRKRANWLECEIRDLSIYELTFLPNNITRIYKPSPGNKFCCLFSFFAAFTKALTLALASRAHIRTHAHTFLAIQQNSWQKGLLSIYIGFGFGSDAAACDCDRCSIAAKDVFKWEKRGKKLLF